MRKLVFFSLLVFLFQNCQNSAPGDERRLQEVKTPGESEIQKIIRNPITASGNSDTTNVAKMDFAVDTFFFGKVKEGEIINFDFEFVNSGKAPLLIHGARSTCGCTIPKWPKEPIGPGSSSQIKVEFNTENKSGFQHKPVTITANTYPNTTVVHMVGEVEKKEK